MRAEKFNLAATVLASLRLGLLDVKEAKGKLGCLKKVRKNGECSLDLEVVEFMTVWKSGKASSHNCWVFGESISFRKKTYDHSLPTFY